MRNPKDKYSLIMSSKDEQLNFLGTILKSKDNFEKEGIEDDNRVLEKDEDMKALMDEPASKMRGFTGADDFF